MLWWVVWVGVGVGRVCGYGVGVWVVLNKALRMEVGETDAGGLCG